MKKAGKNILLIAILLIAAFIYYYITIPAFNIHSIGTWWFLIGGIAAISILVMMKGILRDHQRIEIKKGNMNLEFHAGIFTKVGLEIA